MKHIALATITLLALAGCTALAGRDPGAPLCVIVDGVDPCPAPSRCVEGHCEMLSCVGEPSPEECDSADNDCDGRIDEESCAEGRCVDRECRTDCAPTEVRCDNIDDDCDGLVDEGLSRDEDDDTYSACPQDGTLQDCNDRNEAVNPRALEVCNGIDDDCNPATGESATGICPSGETCAVPTGESIPRCVDPRDCSQFPCRDGEICNASNECCEIGTAGCGTASDCTTTGCPSGARCLPDATGGTFSCVDFGRAGDACTRGSDCTSGRCYPRAALALEGTGNVCGVACCSDEQCVGDDEICWAPGTGARSCLPRSLLPAVTPVACTQTSQCVGEVCGAHTFALPGGTEDGAGWTCAPAAARMCPSGAACPSGLCAGDQCITPCGRSLGQCPYDFDTQQACIYFPLTTGEWLTGCGDPYGYGRQGAECGGAFDLIGCVDGLCFSGQCADVCCSDTDCPSGTACTPYDNSGWEMRCLPRAAPGPG